MLSPRNKTQTYNVSYSKSDEIDDVEMSKPKRVISFKVE